MALLGGVAQLAGGANPQQLDESNEGEEDNALKDQSALKDVFWDRIVVFLTTAIIALTALDILTELLRGGSQVVCFIPDSLNVTDGQEAYINNFCAQSVPDTQYLPIFILTHGILIGAWHYIWRSSCASHFNYFLSLASQLIRLSDDPKGFYPQQNRNIVSKLVSEFRTYKRSRILRWYQLKLLAQILTTVASLLLSFLVFTDFEVNFSCPRDPDVDSSWPLPEVQVQCIFTSLRLFLLLQVVDVLLLSFIVLALLGALLWSIWRHPTELGPENVAQFSFTSSVSPSYHVPRPMLHNAKSFCHRFFSRHIFNEINQRFLVPRLTTDLDFLLMMLYRTDSGLGHAFKEGQVYEEYTQLTDADLQGVGSGSEPSLIDPKLVKRDLSQMLKWRLPKNVYDNFVQISVSSTLQIPDVIRGAVLGFTQRAASNTRALDISFGSYGFSTILAKVFRHVGSLNFDPSFKNEDTPVVSFKFPANITGFRCHDNILSQAASSSNQLTELLEGLWSKDDEPDVYKTEFIVIGPMDQFRQINTAKSILEILKAKFLNTSDKRALLLTVVPVSIEGKDARKQFYTFVPPKHLFARIHHPVELVHSDPDTPLPWPNKPSPPEEKGKVESPKPVSEDIQLHPLGPVTVTLEQEANEDEDKLITTHGITPSRVEDTKPVTCAYQLQCGNTICDFELALYQFVWKPKITYAPPRPPSSSSESEASSVEENGREEGKDDTETSGKATPLLTLPKVENTGANVNDTSDK